MTQNKRIAAAEKLKIRIANVLLELLKTTDYQSITITQICSTAGISRPTFYNNFPSIDAVVYYELKRMEIKYHGHHPMSAVFNERFEHFYAFVKNNKEFDILLG